MPATTAFIRREMIAAMPPPLMASGLLLWLRQRLFAGLFNSVLTFLSFVLFSVVGVPLVLLFLICTLGATALIVRRLRVRQGTVRE